MQLSVAIGAMPPYRLQTALRISRMAGADGVEVMFSRAMLDLSDDRLAELAKREGSPILTAHAFLSFRNQTIDQKIATDCASIRAAGTLPDCQSLVLHPPLTGGGPSPDLYRWLDAVCAERDLVRPALKLALENRAENNDGTETQWLDDLRRLHAVAGEWGVWVCLDLAHVVSTGFDVVEALDAIRSRVVNVHLSDAVNRSLRGGMLNGLFRDHRVPGNGVLPIDDVLHELQYSGYKLPVTLELSPVSLRTWMPGAPRRILTASISDLRRRLHQPPTIPAPRIAGHKQIR
jgi:sugar phosphate isomerase/epimerase